MGTMNGSRIHDFAIKYLLRCMCLVFRLGVRLNISENICEKLTIIARYLYID